MAEPHPALAAEARHLAPGITEEAALAERVFVRGLGSRLFDSDGACYLDFGSGILTQNVGHSHPRVTAALQAQLERLVNAHDTATPERATLCEDLAAVFPPHLTRFAFFSSGTEAVEAAMRAVHGYCGEARPVIAALQGGFHGKTQGSRALVRWNIGGIDISPRARQFASARDCDADVARAIADEILSADDLAALVFEPIQAAAGVIIPPRAYWDVIADACRRKGVLLIADEIVSAGGRTGAFLACEHYGIEPDLVTAAKGLSSGIPFSLLAGREEIMTSGFFAAPGASSSTFGGNPLSCVAVSATLHVLRDENVIAGMPPASARLSAGLEHLSERFPGSIAAVRIIGLLAAIEFHTAHLASAFYQACLGHGVRVALGGVIARLAPPLNVTSAEIDEALSAFAAALADLDPPN